MSTTESKLTALFLDAINWGRSYGQRLSISDLAFSDAAEGFAGEACAALALPSSSGAEPHADKALTEAALAWWEGHRPRDWDAEKHRQHPDVNCANLESSDLARACAVMDLAQAEAAKGASHG